MGSSALADAQASARRPPFASDFLPAFVVVVVLVFPAFPVFAAEVWFRMVCAPSE